MHNFFHRVYGFVNEIPVLGSAFERLRDWRSLKSYQNQGYYSQHKEDLFLLEYFGDRVGNYIDIGANHPFRISNTYLLYLKGWSGIIVEPIKYQLDAHRKLRPRDKHLNLALGSTSGQLTFYQLIPSSYSTFDKASYEQMITEGKARLRKQYDVPVMSLRELFETQLPTTECDFLSIDTEGLDFEILSSNDWARFRPRLVICEANNEEEAATSLNLLSNSGYREIKRLGCNLIFERIDA